MFTFTLDSFNTVTHHLKRVVVEIGLCGCTKLSSNWFVPAFLNEVNDVLALWFSKFQVQTRLPYH